MAVDGVTATGGLIGGGTSGNVNVRLDAPVSLLNGGTGVSAFSGTQVANAIGAVPTSGGTMSGNLTVNGGLVVGDPVDANLGAGTVNIKNLLQVNAATAPTGALPGTHVHIEGEDGARFLATAIGAGSGAVLTLRAANSVAGSGILEPSQGGNTLGIMAFMGYGATGWSSTARARILGLATENWTDANQGAALSFEATTDGTAANAPRMRLQKGLVVGNPTGGDVAIGAINCESLYVGGAAVGAGTGSLPLGGGTLTGGLVIGTPPDSNLGAGTLNVDQTIQINATSGIDPLLPGTHFHIASEDGARMLITNYGTSGQPVLTFRSARGSPGTTILPSLNGDVLGIVAMLGRGATDFSPSGRARIMGYADEAFTDGAQGTVMTFETTEVGTINTVYSMSIRPDKVWVRGDIDVGGAMVGASDRRLKQNIEPWDKCGLDAVRQLNPISYQFNGLDGTVADGRKRVGLDADDTADVIPEIVGTRRSGYKTIEPLSVTYALINAVKELADRLEALERR